jgi:hypothetical protein
MHTEALGIFTLQTKHWIGLDCTYVNKFMRVKIKGRIDPRALANARRINPSSVRMCHAMHNKGITGLDAPRDHVTMR